MLLRLDGQGPRYGQITRALSALIQGGALAPGARLPPTRDLARDLSCSRNLVLLAYEQLTLEGYLVSRGGAGTFVSPDLPAGQAAPTASDGKRAIDARSADLSRHGRRMARTAATAIARYQRQGPVEIDFVYGLLEPDARMVAAVRTGVSAALRDGSFGYSRAAGDDELRRMLAIRLRTNRGIARTVDRMLITNGTQQALDLCVRLLVGEADRVVIEDPTYDGANSIFEAAGADIVRVPVDEHGIVVSDLPEDGRPVRLAYVTPSHQFPTGAVLSAARRYALLAWARRCGTWIFEDDYDSETRYTGRPLEALAAIDPDDRVIYCGTFAKSLFPSLRLAYLSLPADLAEAAAGAKWLGDRGSSALLQRVVRDLMATGEYDRHLRRVFRRHRERRDVLVRALRTHLGDDVAIEGAEAGAHVVAWLPRLATDQVAAIVAGCAARGVGVHPMAGGMAVHAARPLTPGLLLGYATVDVADIERGVRILAEVYDGVTAAPGQRAATDGASKSSESSKPVEAIRRADGER